MNEHMGNYVFVIVPGGLMAAFIPGLTVKVPM